MEAEYVAMARVLRRTSFIQYIWSNTFPDRDIGCTPVKEETPQGAIHLARNRVITPNSKQIDVRHHIIRERVANWEFEVVHVPSARQHADFSPSPSTRRRFVFTTTCVMDVR